MSSNTRDSLSDETDKEYFMSELSDIFPLSALFPVKKSLGIILVLTFAASLLAFGSETTYFMIGSMRDALGLRPFQLYYLACGVLVISLLYWYIYIFSFKFGIKDGTFYIKKGVFIKGIFDYPITSIDNTSLRRDPLDWCLGLCTIQLMTAHEDSDDMAAIRGISYKAGKELHSYLRKLLAVHQASRQDIVQLQERFKYSANSK